MATTYLWPWEAALRVGPKGMRNTVVYMHLFAHLPAAHVCSPRTRTENIHSTKKSFFAPLVHNILRRDSCQWRKTMDSIFFLFQFYWRLLFLLYAPFSPPPIPSSDGVMDLEVLFRLYERFIVDSPPIRMLVKIKMTIARRHLGGPFPCDKDCSWDGYVPKKPTWQFHF